MSETNTNFYSSVNPRFAHSKITPNISLLNSCHPISILSTPKNVKILPRLEQDK